MLINDVNYLPQQCFKIAVYLFIITAIPNQ